MFKEMILSQKKVEYLLQVRNESLPQVGDFKYVDILLTDSSSHS